MHTQAHTQQRFPAAACTIAPSVQAANRHGADGCQQARRAQQGALLAKGLALVRLVTPHHHDCKQHRLQHAAAGATGARVQRCAPVPGATAAVARRLSRLHTALGHACITHMPAVMYEGEQPLVESGKTPLEPTAIASPTAQRSTQHSAQRLLLCFVQPPP